jgi:hypothetical protein
MKTISSPQILDPWSFCFVLNYYSTPHLLKLTSILYPKIPSRPVLRRHPKLPLYPKGRSRQIARSYPKGHFRQVVGSYPKDRSRQLLRSYPEARLRQVVMIYPKRHSRQVLRIYSKSLLKTFLRQILGRYLKSPSQRRLLKRYFQIFPSCLKTTRVSTSGYSTTRLLLPLLLGPPSQLCLPIKNDFHGSNKHEFCVTYGLYESSLAFGCGDILLSLTDQIYALYELFLCTNIRGTGYL